MELAEPIEQINSQLRDEYGYHSITKPYFHVVWSENELEKRLGTFNDIVNGIFIREVTEVREVPKYKQWIQAKYLLEKLTVIPVFDKKELLEEQLSYEPLWVFEDKKGEYLPPRFIVCKFVIEQHLGRLGQSQFARYAEKNESPEEHEIRLKEMEQLLFGNETSITDSLARDEAVGYGVRQRNDSRIKEIKK
jgi:hypothetical protein